MYNCYNIRARIWRWGPCFRCDGKDLGHVSEDGGAEEDGYTKEPTFPKPRIMFGC